MMRLPLPPNWAFAGSPATRAFSARTLNIGFGRDGDGIPSNADRLYAPLRVRLGEREISGVFRDHYLSDLVGFVYSRMDSASAAEDLYRRVRAGRRPRACRQAR